MWCFWWRRRRGTGGLGLWGFGGSLKFGEGRGRGALLWRCVSPRKRFLSC